MNTYVVIFNGHYSFYNCVVIANDENKAKQLALEAVKKYTGWNNENYNVSYIILPLTTNIDEEKVLYTNGYEE